VPRLQQPVPVGTAGAIHDQKKATRSQPSEYFRRKLSTISASVYPYFTSIK
jgi:hypothetical protein